MVGKVFRDKVFWVYFLVVAQNEEIHLCGTQLPVPCIGCVEVVPGQAQSTHVHRVCHLQEGK